MKTLSRKRKSVVLAVAFTAVAALGSLVYAACFGGITVYWGDGSSSSCRSFCTFSGGWLCEV